MHAFTSRFRGNVPRAGAGLTFLHQAITGKVPFRREEFIPQLNELPGDWPVAGGNRRLRASGFFTELSVPGSVFRRLVRVGDLDDVQRLVQAFGVLLPRRIARYSPHYAHGDESTARIGYRL